MSNSLTILVVQQKRDVLAAALESGGHLRFNYQEGETLLGAITEYRTKRALSEAELRLLVDYTMGQWSDGIGENWTCESHEHCGYTVMCLTPGDDVPDGYPRVHTIDEASNA